ncbi:thioredoxin family protein [Pseudomonas fluorescens]
MGIARMAYNDLKDYEAQLKKYAVAIVLFTHPNCEACVGLDETFETIAKQYPGPVTALIVNTGQNPRVPSVPGTPATLVYLFGKEEEQHVGRPLDTDAFFSDLFEDYSSRAVTAPV